MCEESSFHLGDELEVTELSGFIYFNVQYFFMKKINFLLYYNQILGLLLIQGEMAVLYERFCMMYGTMIPYIDCFIAIVKVLV